MICSVRCPSPIYASQLVAHPRRSDGSPLILPPPHSAVAGYRQPLHESLGPPCDDSPLSRSLVTALNTDQRGALRSGVRERPVGVGPLAATGPAGALFAPPSTAPIVSCRPPPCCVDASAHVYCTVAVKSMHRLRRGRHDAGRSP